MTVLLIWRWRASSSTRVWTRSWASRLESGSAIRDTSRGPPLALPAGALAGFAVKQVAEVEPVGNLADPLVDRLAALARQLEAEAQVVGHVHVRVERVGLEDHRDVALARGEVGYPPAADVDIATGGLLEPGHDPQRRA